jgi:hypothetical protein
MDEIEEQYKDQAVIDENEQKESKKYKGETELQELARLVGNYDKEE